VTAGLACVGSPAAPRSLAKARQALDRLGPGGRLLVGWTACPEEAQFGTEHIATGEADGSAAIHDRLMRKAFEMGATLYVALDPGGQLHPDAILALARMDEAQGGRTILGARIFPFEDPMPYDPVTLDLPAANPSCLAVPRAVFEATGGFDAAFDAVGAAVDLCQRAVARGFSVRTNPLALFLCGERPVLSPGDAARLAARWPEASAEAGARW
jgi:hypothetical protein